MIYYKTSYNNMSNIELYTPETNNEIETKINLLQKIIIIKT